MRMNSKFTTSLLAAVALGIAACSGGLGGRGDSSNGNGAGNEGGNAGAGDFPGNGGNGEPSIDDRPPLSPDACTVLFRPLSAPALTNLPAGPDKTVNIQCESSSRPLPGESWSWEVVHAGTLIPVIPDPKDRSIVTLPLNNEGRYEIKVTRGECRGTTTVSAVFSNRRTAYYWVRIIPPETGAVLPHEGGVGIRADLMEQASFELPSGFAVPVDPRAPNALELATAIPSYLRLSASGSSFLQEGRSTSQGVATFRVQPLKTYTLVVIPDNGWAPRLFDRLMLSGDEKPAFDQTDNTNFELTQGTEIRAQLREGGFAVMGARILFRAGELPSTLGSSDNTGKARVFAAGDGNRRFGLQLIAPTGTGLPDLSVDESMGMLLPSPRGTPEAMTIDWSTLPRGKLEVVIVSDKTGLPQRDAEVIAQFAAPMPRAGTALLEGGESVSLLGKLKRSGKSDGNGKVVFDALPRTRYTLTVNPPPGADSPLVTSVDLSTVDPGPMTIRLQERVRVSGKLTGIIAPGMLVEAVPDDRSDNRTATASVMPDGGYSLLLDREKNYRLRLRMTDPSRLSLPIGALASGTITRQLPERPIPRTLSLEGVATNRSIGVPGALVEVYCLAESPDCVDFRKPNVNGAMRIAEGRTDKKGMFQIPLPDPSDE